MGLLRLRDFIFQCGFVAFVGFFFFGVGLLGWMIGVGLLDRCRFVSLWWLFLLLLLLFIKVVVARWLVVGVSWVCLVEG